MKGLQNWVHYCWYACLQKIQEETENTSHLVSTATAFDAITLDLSAVSHLEFLNGPLVTCNPVDENRQLEVFGIFIETDWDHKREGEELWSFKVWEWSFMWHEF